MEPGEKSDDMTGSPCPDRELVHLKYFIKNMLPFESVILLTGTKIKNILVNSNQINWKIGVLPIASDFQITVVNLKLRENIQIWSLKGVTGYERKW